MKNKLTVLAVIIVLSFSGTAYAQTAPTTATPATGFSRQGIFGCNRNGAALSGSVGAFSATGGVYVPVADYTVELNTGTLVYQQCVLRGIVNREGESVNAAGIQKTVQTAVTGRDGKPLFVSNKTAEDLVDFSDPEFLATIQSKLTESINPEFQARVRQEAARSYMQQTRAREKELECPETGANLTGIDAILARANPACYDIGASNLYNDMWQDNITRNIRDVTEERSWGQGYYAVTKLDENGNRITLTPATDVNEITTQALTSGFRRIENANDVDQMVGALYAGLGSQVLSGSGGLLSGLTSAIGSQPPYLTQLTAESSAGLRTAANNAALQVLAGARQAEVQYNSVVTAIANTLTGTIGQLRGIENTCWGLIAFNTTALHVCTAAPNGKTCTDANGGTVKIATSTAFSQPIIDAQIAPLATTVVQNVNKSNQALTLIDGLISGITNTTSLDAQRIAQIQLDQLVSQGKLHTQTDVTQIQQQQTAVTDTMASLIDSTKKTWGDNTDPAIGWCNVQSQSLIDTWIAKWK